MREEQDKNFYSKNEICLLGPDIKFVDRDNRAFLISKIESYPQTLQCVSIQSGT